MNEHLVEREHHLKPFLSVLIITFTLFVIVFFKMEVRRIGYEVFTMNRNLQEERDYLREAEIKLAKLIRPEKIHQVAENKLTMKAAGVGQVIYLAADKNVQSPNPDL